jgi:hypothetical protein
MIELLKNHGTETFIKSTASNLFGDRYKELFPEKIKEHINYFRKLPSEALIAGIIAMRNRPDRTHVLKSMPFPILFIIGMQDKLIPFESLISLSEFPKQSYPFILRKQVIWAWSSGRTQRRG